MPVVCPPPDASLSVRNDCYGVTLVLFSGLHSAQSIGFNCGFTLSRE